MSSREEDVFKALSNPVGLKLFKSIATAALADSSMLLTSDFLNSQTKVTRKQFYSNMSRLVNKTGLILKKGGHYTLSNYGKVVFHSLNIINRGSKCFWVLKALDSTNLSPTDIPSEQMSEISARLIEDEDIQKIVCGHVIGNWPKKVVSYEHRINQLEENQEEETGELKETTTNYQTGSAYL
jgi:hypothetical protein